MKRRTLSVVVPTKDVAEILPRMLDALRWADEIIVVDTFSTDATPEIARGYPNVKFFQWVHPVAFSTPSAVNYALDRASGDWVLRLDADEVATPELAREIQELLSGEEPPFDGYFIPYRNYFFGKWIRWGVAHNPAAYPRQGYAYRHALWSRGMARYPEHHEHEGMEVQGRWGYLEHHYDHFTTASVSEWVRKMNFYTDNDVARLSPDDPEFKRYHPWKTIAAAARMFYTHYWKLQGYRDGMHGFMLAGLNAVYLFVLRCKMWERLEQQSAVGTQQSAGSSGTPNA